jgi:serine/threonine protein kinase
LVSRGDLDADDSSALEVTVVRHLKKHGNDIEKSLAAVPAGRSTHAGLASLGDAGLEPGVTRIGSATIREDDDPYRTVSHSVGATANDGLRFRILKLLRRFTDVCNAAEYSHSRAALHRDWKPANIIVG